MPFDSQGKFSRLYSWEQDRINDIDIVSDRHDEEDDNFAAGLNECMLRDGRCVMSGNLNMGNFQIKNVANGQADNEAVNRGQLNGVENTLINTIKTLLNSVVPVGTIIPSLQDTNHDNWLLCNGQEISRTVYPELFAIIGSTFGSGDGVTTFNVPDYRGKFLRGFGGDSASDVGLTQPEGLPNITGSFTFSGIDPLTYNGAASGAFAKSNATGAGNGHNGNAVDASITFDFDASKSSQIYGANQHVTPVNQAVNWFIKAKGE